MDYERKIFAIANLRNMIMARGVMTDRGLVYRERVAVVAPTHVVVYISPINGTHKYEITLREPR